MKKMFFLFLVFLNSNVHAEVYHGIDIDYIYNNSDWSSIEDIQKVIDDYTLLIKYQNEFNHCPTTLPQNIHCYDKITKKVITNFYVYPEANLKQYQHLKEVVSQAFELKNCHNKYTWPAGNLCNIENTSNLADFLKKYFQDLISSTKEKMLIYLPALEKYK